MKKQNHKFDTLAIHAGGKKKNPENALNYPIFMTSTFTFDDLDHVEKVMSFESDDYVYTRGNNPTLRHLEQRISALEGGIAAVAFSSGMAAISSVLFSLLKSGEKVIAHNILYGSTHNVITKLLPKYGMGYKLADLTKPDDFISAIDEKVKIVYFETPVNPDLSIIDINKIVKIAHKNGIKVVVDNTFATPYFQRPLSLGADVVVHSATKYIGGHGDVVAGLAISNDQDYINYLKFDYMCEFGGVMSPFNGWLLLRGIKTLGLRMREQEKNAKILAKFLQAHSMVTKVNYPGLKNFSGFELAKEQMIGFGAMLSFEVIGGLETARKIVSNLKLAKLAVSLGDCETLVELPAAMTHRGYSSIELKKYGLSLSLIRVSVGLEDIADILGDFEQTLKNI
ncbi:MAG: aminotransferase class I/II-fold pyridoxal phosphate-dependent enzyme [Candidatus Cloacimonetes bacterium]|nr:aminotransferase class I/II-fold pyridoxal phosphate-dependent enzyme [Candidatus Cloacimonadota bacterium]